jgi:hypothetical protein
MTERRRFLAAAGGTIAAAAATAVVDAPRVVAQPNIQWRMSTTRTPTLDSLQGSAQRLAKVIEEASGGRLRTDISRVVRSCRRSSVSRPHNAEPSRRSWPPRRKSPMARKVRASFTKFQALVGPWDHVAEGAYHRFVPG